MKDVCLRTGVDDTSRLAVNQKPRLRELRKELDDFGQTMESVITMWRQCSRFIVLKCSCQLVCAAIYAR